MKRYLKGFFALVLSLMLAGTPAMEGFAEGTGEAQVEQTVEATAAPTEEATEEPTEEPTAEPTEEATEEPTEEAAVEPTADATAVPSEEATAEPTEEATEEPTEEATAEPTEEATLEPTAEPTSTPAEETTVEPTEEATEEPTEEPTAEPTEEATAEPTEEGTPEPTEEVTVEPTTEATVEPTAELEMALAVLPAEHPDFVLNKDDSTMTAVVIGYDDTNEKDVVVPARSDGYDIVGIMGSAFAGKAITSVSIPASVLSIGDSAFAGCASLTSATLGNGAASIGANAFKNCALLSSVSFGSGLRTVGASAFSGCTSLASASLGDGVLSIGDGAFSGCTALSSMTFGSGIESIGESAFSGCTSLASAVLKTGVETIGDNAFSGCTLLNQIDLPYDTLTYVGANSFAGCPMVANKFVYSIKNGEVTLERFTGTATEVVIADAVGGKKLSMVADSAFLGKTGVTKVTIGANVRKIGASAFAGLVKLAQVELGGLITIIDTRAFDGCAVLTAVSLPGSLLTIGARAFADTGITSVEIPAEVSSLSASAFDGCAIAEIEVDGANATYSAIDDLLFKISSRTLLRAYGSATEVEVPTSAQVIGASAFAGRTGLKKVTLATTITKIEALAFSGCAALETVTIPDSVTSIAGDAFQDCTGLTVQVYSYGAYAYDFCMNHSITVTVISTDVPPTKMTLSNMVIGIKNKTQIVPTFTPANATCELSFLSSNKSIVAVGADGTIKGKRIGKARIYVLTDNGIMTSCVVRVKAAPRKVTIAAKSATLGVGQTFDLEAELPNGTGGTIAYTTSNDAVATVDEDGIVTAAGIGSCVIRATTYNGKVAKCKVTVAVAPTTLSVKDESLSLGVGQKRYLDWSLDNGQNASALTFVSDNPTVATVTASGRVIARRRGFATVTVTSYNGLSDTVDVTVLKAPKAMSVGDTTITLYAKQDYEIPIKISSGSASGFSFSTSRASVARVSADGTITARKAGTAKIKVKTYNGVKKTILVRVRKAPTKMALNVTGGTLGVGDTFRLVPSFNSGAGAAMTYESSDPTVASVDGDGDVVGLKAGDVTITATTHNGLSRTCELTICAAPASLTVAIDELELGKGETYDIEPVVKDTDGNDYKGRVFYSTSSSGIAKVNGSGKIKAKNPGSVTITVSTYNGFKETIQLTVKAKPRGISLNKTSGTLPIGKNYQLVYTLRGTNAGGTVSFNTSNPFVCTVDQTGYLTAVSAGTAVITAYTYNGYKVKCYVTVTVN